MRDLIDKFKLIPHPEGGYYAVVYESKQSVKSPVVNKVRKALTHIYFLLLKGQASIFHKVVHDEIWNFYEGDSLKLIKYNGTAVEEVIIGSGCSDYASIVEGGLYQAAESTGVYSLVGCSILTADPRRRTQTNKHKFFGLLGACLPNDISFAPILSGGEKNTDRGFFEKK